MCYPHHQLREYESITHTFLYSLTCNGEYDTTKLLDVGDDDDDDDEEEE